MKHFVPDLAEQIDATQPIDAITPLIICGGNGTRLWPMSRRHAPKQFQRVGGPDSLTFFQTAVQRHRGRGYHDPVIVTGAMHEGTVRAQLSEIGATARIICEPMGRNTGPAVLAACEMLAAEGQDAAMLVVPADHVIEGDMKPALGEALRAVADGRIVTFGIPPRYAETGFGYVIDAGPLETSGATEDGATELTVPGDPRTGVREVGRFVEKPPEEEAERLIASGKAYWASGLSLFKSGTLITEYRRLDPESAAHVRDAVREGTWNDGTLLLSGAAFMQAAAEPTEGLVFERTDRIALASLDVSWDDVGSWKAMHAVGQADEDGNVLQGDVISLNSRNVLVRADSRLVSVVGLEDVVVVETGDAVLIAHMDASQQIKDVVERLKTDDRSEALSHVEDGVVEVAPLAKEEAESYNIGTVSLEVGQTMRMSAGHRGHQAILVRGTMRATGQGWFKDVIQGGRVYADIHGPIELRNTGDETADLLFVTVDATEAETVKAVVISPDRHD